MIGRKSKKRDVIPSGFRPSRFSSLHSQRSVHVDDEDGGVLSRIEMFFAAHRIILFIFLCGIVSGIFLRGCFTESKGESEEATEQEEVQAKAKIVMPDLTTPVRPAPENFKRDTYLPAIRESEASGAIVNSSFSAGRDLVYVEDDRLWWESDNDGETDDECDHSMHAAMEIPFRRLANFAVTAGWQLRVQEAYRATGIHASKSLHKEGRALDVTVDNLGDVKLTHFEKIAAYEALAKMAWQAGFDWVYYENSAGGGPHIHASVKADGPKMSDFKKKPK